MKKNLKLTAVFIPCEEGGYTAMIREIRGVISEGDTIEEAKENLLDALELMLETEKDEFDTNLLINDVITNEFQIVV